MKYKYRLIFFAIGLVGIGILLWKADLPNIDWSIVFRIDSLLLLTVTCALWFFIYIIHVICYRIILKKESKRIPFFSMLKILCSGFALNYITPAGLVGGEPYRIMELKRYCSTEKSIASTLTFSLLYVFGHILLWITTSIVFLVMLCLGLKAPVWLVIFVLTSGALLLGLFVILILYRKNGFVYPIMRFFCTIPFLKKKLIPVVEKNQQSYIEIDDNIREFRNTPIRFVLCLSMQYFTRLLEALEYFLLFYFFGREFGYTPHFYEGILITGLASLIGNILFFIPMQISTREGGMALALSLLLTSEKAINQVGVGMGLLFRIREFIFIAIGIIMIPGGRQGWKLIENKEEVVGFRKKDKTCRRLY